jgi:hypothetical protein
MLLLDRPPPPVRIRWRLLTWREPAPDATVRLDVALREIVDGRFVPGLTVYIAVERNGRTYTAEYCPFPSSVHRRSAPTHSDLRPDDSHCCAGLPRVTTGPLAGATRPGRSPLSPTSSWLHLLDMAMPHDGRAYMIVLPGPTPAQDLVAAGGSAGGVEALASFVARPSRGSTGCAARGHAFTGDRPNRTGVQRGPVRRTARAHCCRCTYVEGCQSSPELLDDTITKRRIRVNSVAPRPI